MKNSRLVRDDCRGKYCIFSSLRQAPHSWDNESMMDPWKLKINSQSETQSLFSFESFIVQKSWLKVVTFFQNDDVYGTVETESGSGRSPPHTCCLSLRKGHWMKTVRGSQRPERGRGTQWLSNLYIFPTSRARALQARAITLSKYFWHKPPENTRISTSPN